MFRWDDFRAGTFIHDTPRAYGAVDFDPKLKTPKHMRTSPSEGGETSSEKMSLPAPSLIDKLHENKAWIDWVFREMQLNTKTDGTDISAGNKIAVHVLKKLSAQVEAAVRSGIKYGRLALNATLLWSEPRAGKRGLWQEMSYAAGLAGHHNFYTKAL
jgi:hypothetical protein